MDGSDKIIFLNQQKILDLGFADGHWVYDFLDKDESFFFSVGFYFDRTKTLPPQKNVVLPKIWEMPDQRNVSWESACENRVKHFQDILDRDPVRKLHISWSGGIDSTCIIACLVLYLPSNYWSRITIGASAASVWENPYFFRDVIQKNFQVQDSSVYRPDDNTIMITGGLGDKVLDNELMIRWCAMNPGDQRFSRNQDRFLNFLQELVSERDRAERIMDMLQQTASTKNIGIESVCDALWWLQFNFCWSEITTSWAGRPNYKSWSFNNYVSGRLVSWYGTDDYQCWAMSNVNRMPDADGFFDNYKSVSKKTIYAVDKNDYFLKFKQKMPSITHLNRELNPNSSVWLLAVDSLGNFIESSDDTIEQDLDKLGLNPTSGQTPDSLSLHQNKKYSVLA